MTLERQSSKSLDDIKVALTGTVYIGNYSIGKEDAVIIAPSPIIDQITSIKNADDTMILGWEKMNESNGYKTVIIATAAQSTITIHF